MNWVSIGLGKALARNRRQAITWTSAGSLPIGLVGTNFSEIRIISIQENAYEIVVCQSGGHFVQKEMS